MSIQELINLLPEEEKPKLSDGYHSFEELYTFRKLYNALIFNEWSRQGKYQVHKSICHYDGELCFGGGWFIVTALLPTGQISNHYKIHDWDLFNVDIEYKALFEFDNHNSQDVIERLKNLL
jgi:hypothetical protein